IGPSARLAVLGPRDTAGDIRTEYEKEIINLTLALAEENNIEILYLLMPDNPTYLIEPPAYYTELLAWLDKEDIVYLDLTPRMRDEWTTTEAFFLPLNGHFNAGGHTFIAEQIIKENAVKC
ncbi:hypothetical protein GOV11_01015, partial [Candidatus Woesearchaeota archaeon]|nr:hypothetical protein [Candidatus Woesearchaeota archaeon]